MLDTTYQQVERAVPDWIFITSILQKFQNNMTRPRQVAVSFQKKMHRWTRGGEPGQAYGATTGT